MIGWAVGWQEVLVLVLLLGVPEIIAGVVCLAVGLAQKRKGLWITGVVMLAAPLVILLLLVLAVVVIAVLR